jgi:methane/ammonia monooxygenase subunit C
MSIARQPSGQLDIAGKPGERQGVSFYLRDSKWWALAMLGVLGLYSFALWYQRQFGHLYGMDSHAPEFDVYWMRWLYTELALEPVFAVVLWSAVWFTRPRNETTVTAREEVRRYFTFMMWLVVYTFAVYWGASFFAEQDGSWHQVVTRDTSFTPSHVMIFYLSFPVYIIIGVGSLLYAATRLPMYRQHGISVPHVLAIAGPFMILPNVGLNEWGHAFWFMEELFTAPLHWGFVVLGWSGLALGGVLGQIVVRVNELLPQIER